MIRKFTLALLFTIACWSLQAQNPPHPNGGSAPNSGTNIPVGGGAPIDGGLVIMLIAGAAYSSKKAYQIFKQK